MSFDRTLSATIRSVDDAKIELAAVVTPDERSLLEPQASTGSPSRQIVQAWTDLESLLRGRLEHMNIAGVSKLGAVPLLDAALKVSAITDVQSRSLRGLNAMRNLAVHGRDSEVGAERVREFINLSDAMK